MRRTISKRSVQKHRSQLISVTLLLSKLDWSGLQESLLQKYRGPVFLQGVFLGKPTEHPRDVTKYKHATVSTEYVTTFLSPKMHFLFLIHIIRII